MKSQIYVSVGIAHNKTLNDHPLPIQAWHPSVHSIDGIGSLSNPVV